MRQAVKRLILFVLDILLKPFVLLGAPVFYLVARTGIGADLCRRFRFQPIWLHFYQPIPEYEKVPDEYFTRRQDFPGFCIDDEVIRQTLSLLGSYASEISWPREPGGDGKYFSSNPNFGLSSGLLLYSMVRAHGSRRVIEIGGGYSSLVSLEALKRNHGATGFEFICVEPYPMPWLERTIDGLSPAARLVKSAVEGVDPMLLTALDENDILFIDSSHVSKLASDVNFLYVQILPRLKSGVIVHIHDIYIPYEYPVIHFRGRSKLFWNEQYLLQALLTDNPKFEVLLPGYYAQRDMQTVFVAAFPAVDPARDRMTSSFWLRRSG